MPAFRETLSDREIWQIVLFTKHMNSLPSGTQKAWVAGKASPQPYRLLNRWIIIARSVCRDSRYCFLYDFLESQKLLASFSIFASRV